MFNTDAVCKPPVYKSSFLFVYCKGSFRVIPFRIIGLVSYHFAG